MKIETYSDPDKMEQVYKIRFTDWELATIDLSDLTKNILNELQKEAKVSDIILGLSILAGIIEQKVAK